MFSSLSVDFNKLCSFLLSFKGASTIFILAIYQFNKSDVFSFKELYSKSYKVSCELMSTPEQGLQECDFLDEIC